MLIDRIYAPVTTLGAGTRIAVWTVGCSKHCKGCANPELWSANPGKSMDDARLADALVGMARHSGIRRITFTGGDPFEQPESLVRVLSVIRPHFDDILVYTGFTLDELRAEASRKLAVDAALEHIDVLVDGPYVEALNDGVCAMRGSSNQRVHVFNVGLRDDYDAALKQPRRIQNVHFGGTFMSVGIHGRP